MNATNERFYKAFIVFYNTPGKDWTPVEWGAKGKTAAQAMESLYDILTERLSETMGRFLLLKLWTWSLMRFAEDKQLTVLSQSVAEMKAAVSGYVPPYKRKASGST
jgi:hypothetical protein